MIIQLIAGLLGLLCFLICLAVVGHALWLLGAALWRGLFPKEPPAPTRPSPTPASRLASCVRCGKPHEVGQRQCSYCGLFLDGELAGELRELEIVVRRVQRFRDDRLLDPEVCEQIYRCVEDRQQTLLRPGTPLPRPKLPPRPALKEEEILDVLPLEPGEEGADHTVVSEPVSVPPLEIAVPPITEPIPVPPRRRGGR